MAVRRILAVSGWFLGALAMAGALFSLAGWIGSSIPRNGDWREADGPVTILIETNGVHTAIVLPLVTPYKDWRDDFPARDLPASGRDYTHVSIGWGARAIFLDTPRWRDLRPRAAIRSALGDSALLHVSHYVRPAPGDDIRPLRLRPGEYARLVDSISRQMVPRRELRRYAGYDDHDVFYSARGTYHLFHGCNQWVSDRLAEAGIRTGLWTPFAGGVMKWVPRPGAH